MAKRKKNDDVETELSGENDLEIEILFRNLESAPWNPKAKIHGIYRAGLKGSLEYFGNRDRLKVWENPQKKGYYYVLDGNQRLDLIEESLKQNVFDSLVEQELSELDLVDENGDDLEENEIEKLRKEIGTRLTNNEETDNILDKAISTELIPCRVLSDLDSDDAKAFTAIFDRNHASYDEYKLIQIQESLDKNKERYANKLEKMIRPVRSYVPPPPPKPTLSINGSTREDLFEKPASKLEKEFDPENVDMDSPAPWGAPPELPESSTEINKPSLIPLLLSLTPEGYEEITQGVLRSKARLLREKRVIEALNSIQENEEENSLNESIIEIALIVISRRAHIK